MVSNGFNLTYKQMQLSIEEKAGFLMDFLQWLAEQDYHMGYVGRNEPGSSPLVLPNYAQLMADYLNLDWGQALALARLPAIENRLIDPGRIVDETPPMPTAEDLVQAFILSRQTFRH
jgi:hypothetical protein